MKAALLLVVLFPLLLFAAGEEDSIPALPAGDLEVLLTVKDTSTLSGFPGRVVSITYLGDEDRKKSVSLASNESIVRASLDSGVWLLHAEIDDPATPGSDHAGFLRLNVTNQTSADLLLEPVGSVQGFVVDASNRTVSGARLQLQCASSFFDPSSLNDFPESDEFGAFSLRFVPAGSCKVLASSAGMVGSLDVALEGGELKNVLIPLSSSKSVQENPDGMLPYVLSAAVLLVILAFYFFWRRPRRSIPSKAHAVRTNVQSPPRHRAARRTAKMDAIMRTLPEGERRIVEFLLENGGRGRLSKVFYALLIPKTTLSRLVFSLENKNIVKTQKFGKIRQLELTEWFISDKRD
ncbi:MAG: hypothetical protein V1787_03650 [Candidatus Micrarchaeota archaeon]